SNQLRPGLHANGSFSGEFSRHHRTWIYESQIFFLQKSDSIPVRKHYPPMTALLQIHLLFSSSIKRKNTRSCFQTPTYNPHHSKSSEIRPARKHLLLPCIFEFLSGLIHIVPACNSTISTDQA